MNPDFLKRKIIFQISGCDCKIKNHFHKNADAFFKMKTIFEIPPAILHKQKYFLRIK